jgi:hypothetical protein
MIRVDPPESVDNSDLIDGPTTKLPVYSTTGLVPSVPSVPYRGDEFSADKLATAVHTAPPDPDRTQMVQRIAIETRMYQQFRMVIKQQLQRFEHRRRRQQLNEILTETSTDADSVYDSITFRARISQLRTLVEELMAGHVDFQDLSKIAGTTYQISEKKCISNSSSAAGSGSGDENECKIILPIRHLVTGTDNRILYPMRISDELLRYRRIRLFLLDPNYYLNMATVSSTAYDIADDELLVLEPALTSEFFRNLVPLSTSGDYIQRTNYDTAIPASTSETYIQRLTTEQQRELVAPAHTLDTTTTGIMHKCMLTPTDMVGGTHGEWKKAFPKTTQEVKFNLISPDCFFAPIVYVLHDMNPSANISELEQQARAALIAGYTRRIENEDKMRRILTLQGKSTASAKNVPVILWNNLVSDPQYYLTDLDLWIVCQELKLPVVLFSSTKLKHMVDVKWMYLGSDPYPNVTTPIYFIRSPPNVLKDTPPTYSILTEPYTYSQLKTVGKELQQGFTMDMETNEYVYNVQSLDKFLQDFQILLR